MPSIRELLNNLPNFQYYSGVGNFTANNIPFGSDRPNGGNSGEPYIVREIGQKWSPGGVSTGIPPFGFITSLTRASADLIRIGKFLTDVPKGPLWLGKQVGLQMMNPQISRITDLNTSRPTTGQGFINNVINGVSNTVNRITNEFGETRLYNPLGASLLAQTGLSGTGVHFKRHGLIPRLAGSENEDQKYEKLAEQEDRLVTLTTRLARSSYVKNYSLPLYQYKGGPASFLGIGDTIIKRSPKRDRESVFAAGILNNSDTFESTNSFIPIDIETIRSINAVGVIPSETNTTNDTVISDEFDFSKRDFREYKNTLVGGNAGNTILTNTDYRKYNIEDRIGTIKSRYGSKYRKNFASDFGSSGSLSDYWVKGPTDMVNSISLYKSSAPLGDPGGTVNDVNGNSIGRGGQLELRDMIKFRIKIFDNDNQDPASGVYMVFRAFLDSFNNSMMSKWNPYTYVGRGEEFQIYEGFNELYSVGFTIAALSRSEMKPLYQKLNYLKSSMAPDYKGGKMRGNVAELTVGDYIHYQPGVITDLNITVPQEANWEIAIDYLSGETGAESTGNDKDMHELPQLLKVNFNFVPIYGFLPRKGTNVPFIGINDYRGNYNLNNIDLKNQREWLRANPA